MKVLVIEDNKADFVLIKSMLEEQNNERIDLHWAKTLEMGIEKATMNSFGLVLLDLGLPDSMGIETFETFYSACPNIPIIILSGNNDDTTAVLAVRNGAQDYISKSNYSPYILKRAIKYAVERKITLEALSESEEKFKIIFNESLDVVMIIDIYSGLIHNINSAAFNLMGYKRKLVIGKHYSTLLPNDVYLSKQDFIGKVMTNGSVFESEIFEKSDGKHIIMDVSATFIPWGKSKAILVSLRDASERLSVENAIDELNEQLDKRVLNKTSELTHNLHELEKENSIRYIAEKYLIKAKNEITKSWLKEKELSELKNKFISHISEDYKAPLSEIAASAEYIELLSKSDKPAKFQKHLDNILNSVNLMTKLLENVNIIERINSGYDKMKLEQIDLALFLKATIDNSLYFVNSSHIVGLSCHNINSKILIDKSILHGIIVNLINNAIMFSEQDSEIKIECGIDNQTLMLSLNIDKLKISTNDIKMKLNSVNFVPDNQKKSFGIGLYIVKTCVNFLGGSIHIDSKFSIGNVISMQIPIETV